MEATGKIAWSHSYMTFGLTWKSHIKQTIDNIKIRAGQLYSFLATNSKLNKKK